MELHVYYILIMYYYVGYYHYYWNRQGEGPEGEVADFERFPLAPPSRLAARGSRLASPRLARLASSRLSPRLASRLQNSNCRCGTVAVLRLRLRFR